MEPHKDLREFIAFLERRGKLYRYREPINKETELIPFHRVQMRGLPEEERRAVLFENVVGADGRKYEMSALVGCYAASEQILAWGMGCETYAEAIGRFHQGLLHPIPVKMVKDGPVHEEIHVGDDLKKLGLDELPAPVEEVGLGGMVRTGMPMITRDPETGVTNMGTYNGFFRARDRMAVGISPTRIPVSEHWRKARQRREKLPVAILVGMTPVLMATSSAEVPYGMPGLDELTLAGGISGRPVEMVRCKTIPLEVPANTEIVIEGEILPDVLEPRLPFGEYPGYLSAEMNLIPVMQVTAITHRRNAIFTPIIVGMAPSDCNVVWGYAHNALMLHYLRYEHNLPVEEVYYPQEAGAVILCLIRVKDGVGPGVVNQILQVAAGHPGIRSKYTIAVDYDINLRDQEVVMWALATRTQPVEDLTIVRGGGAGGLDPSSILTGSDRGRMSSTGAGSGPAPAGREYSRVLINAVRKWPYPPVALPEKEYMEHALRLWVGRKDLPKPRLRAPWYGYTLGHWPEDLKEYGDLIAKGEWLKVGEMTLKLQQKVGEDVLPASRTAPEHG